MEAVIGVLENHTSFVPQPAQAGASRYRCDFLFSFSGGVPCYHCVIFFWGVLRAITVMLLGMR